MGNIILLSLSVVTLIVGVHQSFYYGIQNSYWAFMLSGGFFLWLQFRKKRQEEKEKEALEQEEKKLSRRQKMVASSKRKKDK